MAIDIWLLLFFTVSVYVTLSTRNGLTIDADNHT